MIVGDVHGCFDELQELLQACNFQPGQDNLVFVGDLVNKGNKSLEVPSQPQTGKLIIAVHIFACLGARLKSA